MHIAIAPGPDINVPTPCEYRSEIYREFVEEIHLAFTHRLIRKFLPRPHLAVPNDPFVNDALSSLQLLESIATILDEKVINGVAKDLAKWRKYAYGRLISARPTAPPEIPTEPVNVDFLLNGEEWTPEQVPARYEQPEISNAYSDYFMLYIARPAQPACRVPVIQGGVTMGGKEAFFRRYPMIANAIVTSACSFRDNIFLACNRILDDRMYIEQIFFEGAVPTRLVEIKPSGSDFHKGGKQVLFLTFEFGDTSTKQLVYKPSDVEIDSRLVGNTSGITDQKSLVEIMNKYYQDYTLPTYKILPVNPGSRLQGDPLPIGNSYGYIEFLSHYPPMDSRTGNPQVDPGWEDAVPLDFDWISDNAADHAKFYRQWGRFLALATIFSISDLHHGNVIVHDRQPYLIDLEVSFTGPMKTLSGTLYDMGMFSEAERVEKCYRYGDKTIRLIVSSETLDQTKKTYNRLGMPGDNGTVMNPDPSLYSQFMFLGFYETMRIMHENPLDFFIWLDSIGNAVARFVPYPTAVFKTRTRTVIDPRYCSAQMPATMADYHHLPFDRWQFNAVEAFLNPDHRLDGEARKGWPEPRPNFALQVPEHNFADYLNGDVPAYYHRINSADLLNARGMKVNLRTPNPAGGAPRFPDPGRDSYFTEDTYRIVCHQLEDLYKASFLEVYMKPWEDQLKARFRVDETHMGVIQDFIRHRP